MWFVCKVTVAVTPYVYIFEYIVKDINIYLLYFYRESMLRDQILRGLVEVAEKPKKSFYRGV